MTQFKVEFLINSWVMFDGRRFCESWLDPICTYDDEMLLVVPG